MKYIILASLCTVAVYAQYHGTGGNEGGVQSGAHRGGYGGHNRGRRNPISSTYSRSSAGFYGPSVPSSGYASSVAVPPAPIGGASTGSISGRGHRYVRSPVGIYDGHGIAGYSGASQGVYSSSQSGHISGQRGYTSGVGQIHGSTRGYHG